MKLLGLIGGTSWVSTIDYYRLINEGINKQLGGLNYARCIIHSFNYGEIRKNNDNEDWDANFKLIYEASVHLQNSGVKAIVLCANTMHLLADRLANAIDLPVIHICTATATEIKKQHIQKVGLLGTRFTMERDFFRDKLAEKGIEAIIPPDEDRGFIHGTIFDELGMNILKPETKARYISIINDLTAQGAQGVILGCTEIPLLIKQEDVSVPVFDTTVIHANAIIDFALN
jgi:aspartate racemase